MNRTIKLLMISDVFFFTGFGLISPILAIFVKDNLVGGTILAAGVSSFVYLVAKSLTQMPFARYVDAKPQTRRTFVILGSILMALASLLFIPATHIFTLYVAQLIRGIGSGLAYPCWIGLWLSHLDSHHEGFEWSVYNTTASLGTAVAGVIGAGLVELIGFQWTFLIMAGFAFIGGILLFWLDKNQPHKSLTKASPSQP